MSDIVLQTLKNARVQQVKNVERYARYVRYFTKRRMESYSFVVEAKRMMENQERILRQIDYAIGMFEKWPGLVKETIGYQEARRLKEAS